MNPEQHLICYWLIGYTRGTGSDVKTS